MRNRFLQAAEKVMLSEGMTLREKLDTLPLSEDHFLYNQFKGGFPKGYMFDVSRLLSAKSSFELKADETYRLDLLLIGTVNSLQPQMITALQTMLSDGLGNPPVQLMLQEMKIENQNQVVCTGAYAEPEMNEEWIRQLANAIQVHMRRLCSFPFCSSNLWLSISRLFFAPSPYSSFSFV